MLQRGGLPLPEDDARRARHEQRGPLHTPLPRLERGRAARGHRLGRRDDGLRRHRQRRRRARHRHQHDGQPPRGSDVLQGGGAQRHQADHRQPPPPRARRPRRIRAPQVRRRRRVLQRPDERDPGRGPRGPRLHREVHRGLRSAEGDGRALHAGGRRAALRARAGAHPGARPHHRPRQRDDHLLGHGHLPAPARDRQRPLPHRALHAHRQRRQARYGAPPAARPEQRAGGQRRRPHPDGLSGLRLRRRRRRAPPLRDRVGHVAQTRRPA